MKKKVFWRKRRKVCQNKSAEAEKLDFLINKTRFVTISFVSPCDSLHGFMAVWFH